MDSRKVAGLFVIALFLTGSVAALSIEINLFDFGGDSASANNTSTDDGGDDQRFTYGGEDSDQITDEDGVKKTMMEKIVGAVVNTLFG